MKNLGWLYKCYILLGIKTNMYFIKSICIIILIGNSKILLIDYFGIFIPKVTEIIDCGCTVIIVSNPKVAS